MPVNIFPPYSLHPVFATDGIVLLFAKFNSNVRKIFTRELSYVFNPRDEQNAQLACHLSYLFMSAVISVLIVGSFITVAFFN